MDHEMKYDSALIFSAFENRLRAGLVQHTMQTNAAAGRNKNINGPKVRGIRPVGEERSMEERTC